MGQDQAGFLASLKALRREPIDPSVAKHKAGWLSAKPLSGAEEDRRGSGDRVEVVFNAL